jgi:dienelactone hydrolase
MAWKIPFVSSEMLDAAHLCQVTLSNLQGAKHGFTNPAQDFNPIPAFGFNAKAANLSWTAACNLLQSQLGIIWKE